VEWIYVSFNVKMDFKNQTNSFLDFLFKINKAKGGAENCFAFCFLCIYKILGKNNYIDKNNIMDYYYIIFGILLTIILWIIKIFLKR